MDNTLTNKIVSLVDEFYQLGVRDVVISPGSRSTPIAMIFCEHDFDCYLNIDERSAGFFALGIAKEYRRPVILVCTSGSAVAHYFPAIAEARYSRVPLIIISADRPAELQNVGAPQTIDQVEIFGKYVKRFEQLEIYGTAPNKLRYIRTVAERLYIATMQQPFGVVHLNLPLAEPLMPDFDLLDFTVGRGIHTYRVLTYNGQGIGNLPISIKERKGIIICGPDAYADYGKVVISFAERMKLPVLADPLSNLRNYCSDFLIDSYDSFLGKPGVKEELKAEFIIHIGQVPVSKRLQQFLEILTNPVYIQIDEAGDYRNTSLNTSMLVKATVSATLQCIQMTNGVDENYSESWRKQQLTCRRQLKLIKQEPCLCEGKIIQIIQDMILPDSTLLSANSMSIRNIDFFWESKAQNIKILCNRGTNGIDGTIATALGCAVRNRNTVLITGDLAFLHDISSFVIGKTHGINLTVILFNNNGGGIFTYLPQHGTKYFDYLFRTPHDISFEGVSQLYRIDYFKIECYEQFASAFMKSQYMKGIKLIEVIIDMEDSFQTHKKYI